MSTQCPECNQDLKGEPIKNPFTGQHGNTVQLDIKDDELVLCAEISCPACDWSDARTWNGESMK